MHSGNSKDVSYISFMYTTYGGRDLDCQPCLLVRQLLLDDGLAMLLSETWRAACTHLDVVYYFFFVPDGFRSVDTLSIIYPKVLYLL